MENLKHEIKDTKGCGKRCHASRLASKKTRVSGLTSHVRASWPKVKLGTICSRVTSGGTPSTKRPEYYGGTIPWLRTQEVDFKPIYSTELFITEDGLNNSSAKWIPENTVIVAMYGATAGRSAITKIALTTNQACCNLIIDEAQADYRFVYYSLRLRYEELEGLAKGSAQTNLNAGIIKEFEIPLPPLPVQRRIADILSAYDDLIENNRRRIAILEETARLAYRKWFGGEDRSNEWEVHKVSEVLESFSRPKRVPKESYITDGAYPCIDQGKDFIGGYTNDEEAIVRRLPAIVFGDHTRVLKYVSEPFACGADGTQLLYAKDGVLTQSYLYCALKEIDLTNYFYARHFKILKSKEVFVPSYSIVKQFTDEVSCNLELISVLRKHGVRLAAARDMLLPRLMNNKLRKDA